MDASAAVERMQTKKAEAIAQMHQNVRLAWEEIKSEIEHSLIEALERDASVEVDYLDRSVKMEIYRCTNEKRCGLLMCEFLGQAFTFDEERRDMAIELRRKFNIREIVVDDSTLPDIIVSVVW
jgi:hypothetical protein